MRLKGLFKKNNKESNTEANNIPSVPDGLFVKCPKCDKIVLNDDIVDNYHICPSCGHYFKIKAKDRIQMVADSNTFEEWDIGIENDNPCEFEGYEEKIASLKKRTALDEAVVTGVCCIQGRRTVIGVCDTTFLMGSMGSVVGEKITRAVERATNESLPVIIFTCSGGARMQEGIVSLMQMAKTSAALKKHDEAGNLYITVLTDPTTGGVTASFAMLGDIILAEPGALIGFAGPRVIKQTIRQDLPEGFQRAEFLVEHGFVDSIVRRENLKDKLGLLLKMHDKSRNPKLEKYKEYLDDIYHKKISDDIEYNNAESLIGNGHTNENEQSDNELIEAWDRVQIARGNDRPTAKDYIDHITKEFIELHGDRLFGDDGAIIGGIAMLGRLPVTVIGTQKGTNVSENVLCNFGMAEPEGYRKSLRLIKQAEKFNRPVICFVDTPGAYPGLGAEERGQGEAIARNLFELSSLKVPILSIVTGEGGSGGALALAVANEVWMMENSIYSVLSPEGFASILWKDSSRAKEASGVMKITAQEVKDLGIIERIIPEFTVVTERNINRVTLNLKRMIVDFLIKYMAMDGDELIINRYDRFRKM